MNGKEIDEKNPGANKAPLPTSPQPDQNAEERQPDPVQAEQAVNPDLIPAEDRK